MFASKKSENAVPPVAGTVPTAASPAGQRTARPQTAPRPDKNASPSVLSNDLFVTGNIKAEGDIKVDGRVDGDLVAKLIQIGEKAVVKGKISADEVVINGHVKGKVRGIRVRLNNGAHVEGDILHETIAIEAGAHFEGTVKRQDNPLGQSDGWGSSTPPASGQQQQRRTQPGAPRAEKNQDGN